MRKHNSQSGQTLPLICLFMFSLIGMCALVLDVGGAFVAHRTTQNAADATALAGVSQLGGNWSAAANSEFAKNTLHINGAKVTVSLATDFTTNDSVLATVDFDQPTFFAKAFGYKSIHVHSVARATAQSIHSEINVSLPIALYSSCAPAVGAPIVVYGGNATCGSTPSNVGTIQVPASGATAGNCSGKNASYATVGNGANDIRDILNGTLATGTINVGGCLAQTKTGGKAIGSALTDGINDQTFPFTVLVPVVQQNAGAGQQGTFTVIAFEWISITGCDGSVGAASCSGGSSGKEIDGTVVGAFNGPAGTTPGAYIPGYLNFLGLTQ